MESLQSIFRDYAGREEDIKSYVLKVTKAVLEDMKIKNYFQGFGKLYGDREMVYDKDRRKILLNVEFIVNEALEWCDAYGIPRDGKYQFIYGYVTDLLLFNLKAMEDFYKLEKNEKDLGTLLFKAENHDISSLDIDPFIKDDYNDFYEKCFELYPSNRCRFYYAISNMNLMIKDLGYKELESYLISKYKDVLISTYNYGVSPLEALIGLCYDISCNDEEINCFYDIEKLPFYDDDFSKMHKRMLKYPKENRFIYGLPLKDGEEITVGPLIF